jgi:RNA polymerase sigma factor (sigma-70 family)
MAGHCVNAICSSKLDPSTRPRIVDCKILWRIPARGDVIFLNMSETDLELLARYASQNAEDAFSEIVRRHLDLVHSAALRQVRSPQLAEEVAQSTFLKLARHARKLAPGTILTAWLYQVTRREAIDVVRREARRQLREQIASQINAMNATAADWTHIEPLLDEATHALDDADRTAVLLRYFENKSLREVGQTLGTSEDAAQKRVSRAVERLRAFFAKRGPAIGASGLVAVISANAVQAAPVGLAGTISTAVALAGAAVQTSTAIAATNAIAMTTLQKTLVSIVITASLATPLFVHHRARAKVREQGQTLRQSAEQLAKLRTENEEFSKLLAQPKSSQPVPNDQFSEVLKLRGDVGRLQAAVRDLTGPKTNEPLSRDEVLASMRQLYSDRANRLKQLFVANPAEAVPELQYLTDADWLELTPYDHHRVDADNRHAMSSTRTRAQVRFALNVLDGALRQYGEDNNAQFPSDLSQLAPYLKSPVDVSALQSWTIVPASSFSGRLRLDEDWVITQKVLVNPALERRVVLGMKGHAVD